MTEVRPSRAPNTPGRSPPHVSHEPITGDPGTAVQPLSHGWGCRLCCSPVSQARAGLCCSPDAELHARGRNGNVTGRGQHRGLRMGCPALRSGGTEVPRPGQRRLVGMQTVTSTRDSGPRLIVSLNPWPGCFRERGLGCYVFLHILCHPGFVQVPPPKAEEDGAFSLRSGGSRRQWKVWEPMNLLWSTARS